MFKLDFKGCPNLRNCVPIFFRWWKGYDALKNLHLTRDRLAELYFWAVGVYFEPQYSRPRIFLTKVLLMTNVLDNTYDAYGTCKELENFIEAVERYIHKLVHDMHSMTKAKLVFQNF